MRLKPKTLLFIFRQLKLTVIDKTIHNTFDIFRMILTAVWSLTQRHLTHAHLSSCCRWSETKRRLSLLPVIGQRPNDGYLFSKRRNLLLLFLICSFTLLFKIPALKIYFPKTSFSFTSKSALSPTYRAMILPSLSNKTCVGNAVTP